MLSLASFHSNTHDIKDIKIVVVYILDVHTCSMPLSLSDTHDNIKDMPLDIR